MSDPEDTPHSSWITNGLLGLLLTILVALGGIGRSAYEALSADTKQLTMQGARIEAQLNALDGQQKSHETRQHSQTVQDGRSLSARVAVLELAVELLKREHQ